jgi:hypothetical protein
VAKLYLVNVRNGLPPFIRVECGENKHKKNDVYAVFFEPIWK